MPGIIFYRKRLLSERGVAQPRFQLVALAGVNLRVYGRHLRIGELRAIAGALGAELILLPGSPPSEEGEEFVETA